MDLYKKKYKEAMDRMELCVRSGLKISPEYIFSELAENKDERIRKALKQYFVNSFQNNGVAAICGVHVKDVLDWLEKQGEKHPNCKGFQETGKCFADEELAQAKKNAYNDALDKIEYHSGEPTFDDGWSAAIDYIRKKFIRPQNQWKPYNGHTWGMCARDNGVDISCDKHLIKHLEKQGEQKPLGYVHHIDEDGYYTKEAILEPNPYTGTGFDYNGHHWGMCARDGGVEILMDGNITSRVFPDKNNIIEQKFEMKTAEESLGVDSDTYNKIVDECIFGEQKPADTYCQENCKGFQETGKCFADGECKAKREAEQKPFDYENANIKQKGFAPKVEPKFKDGDVLTGKVDGDNYILIFKQVKDGWVETHGHYYDSVNRFCVPSQLFCKDYQGSFTPATKEQRDLLFQKMKEAGYTFDFDKKELKRIEQKPEENKGNIGGISPNSEWSEEDETTKNNISHIIRQYDKISKRENEPCWYIGDCLLWMQNIKGRVQPKQEWSEEDEQHIDSLLKRLDALCRNKFERTRFAISEDRDWLKSLRPQNMWKPSEDDIIILEKLIKGELEPKVFQATLHGILEQLKKLKEE